MSRTDTKGKIVYSNSEFKTFTGFSLQELKNVNHGIIKHPDMPQVIHDMIWDNARAGKGSEAIIKSRTKDGKTFWSLTEIRPLRNMRDMNRLTGFSVMRLPIGSHVIHEMDTLYRQIKEVENRHGRDAGKRFFLNFLANKNLTYSKYIQFVIGGNNSRLRRFINLTSFS